MKLNARDLQAMGILLRSQARPERPDRMARATLAQQRWGMGMVGAVAFASTRYPDAVAVVDEGGALRYRDVWRRSDAVAEGLRTRGIGPGTTVGLLCRNHRGFVDGLLGVAKVGADLVLMNTSFARRELEICIDAEGITAVIHDHEYAEHLDGASAALLSESEIAALALGSPTGAISPPKHPGRLIILTSGTTGRPRGASRTKGGEVVGTAALLKAIPLRARETSVVAAPLFHSWGLAALVLSLSLSSTVVLHRRFDPVEIMRAVDDHDATALFVVPAMLQRILDLGGQRLVAFDTSSLRVIASSGSALGAPLARRVLHRFGPVLYSLYGSTEVSGATIATPRDLQAAPATAGRPAFGVTVEVLDSRGQRVPVGTSGDIFVGSDSRFEGYSDGTTKDSRRGLLASGDVGHFDAEGRLYIDGRADDMIVSGGENVYPAELEDVLSDHVAVREVAAVGVPDVEFGQRLKAFVALHPGATVDEDELLVYVKGRMARFKVPREIVFVDNLPRNATGKVLRTALA